MSDLTETFKSESVYMLDAADKINFSSRFSKDELSRSVNLRFVYI